MTGYALKTVEFEDYTVHCEIKSLNNKFLEVKLRLPPYMPEIENSLRKFMKASIKRGKVEVYIRVEVKERTEFEIIKSLLRKYYGRDRGRRRFSSSGICVRAPRYEKHTRAP